MTPIEKRLEKIESLLVELLGKKEWISEQEACLLLSRGKDWLQVQRNGLESKGIAPTLIKGKDWKKGMNGRTIEYKRTSLERLKNRLCLKVV